MQSCFKRFLFGFRACIALQDPHCAWDVKQGACVTIDTVPTLTKYLMQDILRGDGKKCAAVTGLKPSYTS